MIGLPPAIGAGLRLKVDSLYTSLKTLQVRTNSELIKQERTPFEDGYRLECIIIGGEDVALTLTCERLFLAVLLVGTTMVTIIMQIV